MLYLEGFCLHMSVFKQKLAPSLTGFLVLAIFALANATFAEEDDEHLGLIEYELACMPCHGVEGRGDGPMAKTLEAAPTDLTRSQRPTTARFHLTIW